MSEGGRFIPPGEIPLEKRGRDRFSSQSNRWDWLAKRVVAEIAERDKNCPSEQAFDHLFQRGKAAYEAGKDNPDSVAYELMAKLPEYVIWEDNDLLVVNKPAGIVTHARPGIPFGLENILQYATKNPVHCVNRLDKDTSGAIVFGKNFDSIMRTKEQFADKATSGIRKVYLTLLDGSFDNPDEITIEVGIGKFAGKMAVVRPDEPLYTSPGVKDSTTHFTPIAALETLDEKARPRSLAVAEIDTGRQHQIRVVAADYLKKPVTGDRLYNSDPSGATRQMLHSYGVTFTHPTTREQLTVEAPIPTDFMDKVREMKQVKSFRK